MSAPEPGTAPARSNSGVVWLFVIAAVAAYFLFRTNAPTPEHLENVLLPPLEVAGWMNTAVPVSNEDLRGKLVVLDCWFVDCPPCRASMPHLAEFNAKFSGQGVQVIGLTPDINADATRAEEFVKSVPGVNWPIAYGAQIPLDILGIHEFPTVILFNRAGRSVWAGHDLYGLEQATLEALAK
ncbi:MAG: TlpA family protein disulfide reductase [Pirellulales bacterium]